MDERVEVMEGRYQTEARIVKCGLRVCNRRRTGCWSSRSGCGGTLGSGWQPFPVSLFPEKGWMLPARFTSEGVGDAGGRPVLSGPPLSYAAIPSSCFARAR